MLVILLLVSISNSATLPFTFSVYIIGDTVVSCTEYLLLLLLNTFIQNRKGDKNASLGGYITPVRKSSLKYKYITDTYKATEKYINHQSLDKQ